MSTWAVIAIIVAVLAVIASNIMLLKYSAKFKMPKSYTPPEASNKYAKQKESASPKSTQSQDSDEPL